MLLTKIVLTYLIALVWTAAIACYTKNTKLVDTCIFIIMSSTLVLSTGFLLGVIWGAP